MILGNDPGVEIESYSWGLGNGQPSRNHLFPSLAKKKIDVSLCGFKEVESIFETIVGSLALRLFCGLT